MDGDLVWVHDYHLFLVPRMIKEKRPRLRVAFFLHTPWPSYEIFRVLPEIGKLVLGLAASDLIGFHTYNYLRHFRSTVSRVLGLPTEIR